MVEVLVEEEEGRDETRLEERGVVERRRRERPWDEEGEGKARLVVDVDRCSLRVEVVSVRLAWTEQLERPIALLRFLHLLSLLDLQLPLLVLRHLLSFFDFLRILYQARLTRILFSQTPEALSRTQRVLQTHQLLLLDSVLPDLLHLWENR